MASILSRPQCVNEFQNTCGTYDIKRATTLQGCNVSVAMSLYSIFKRLLWLTTPKSPKCANVFVLGNSFFEQIPQLGIVMEKLDVITNLNIVAYGFLSISIPYVAT